MQPWRYLVEMASGLAGLGHSVRVITDVNDHPPTINPRLEYVYRTNPASFPARSHPTDLPDAVLWHVGTTSTLRSWPRAHPGLAHIAIFTSPLYRPSHFLSAYKDVLSSPGNYAALLVGSVLPRRFLAAYLSAQYAMTVVLAPSTRKALIAAGIGAQGIVSIPPGRDEDVCESVPRAADTRPTTYVYAGSARAIRGTDVLLRAFSSVKEKLPNARLVMLCRREDDGLRVDERRLRMLIKRLKLNDEVQLTTGSLARPALLRALAAGDVVVLPFRIVPSEAPLLAIEAQALGRPIICSDLPALRDLAAPDSLMTTPGDPGSLAAAMITLGLNQERRVAGAASAARFARTLPTWGDAVHRMDATIRMAIEHVL